MQAGVGVGTPPGVAGRRGVLGGMHVALWGAVPDGLGSLSWRETGVQEFDVGFVKPHVTGKLGWSRQGPLIQVLTQRPAPLSPDPGV